MADKKGLSGGAKIAITLVILVLGIFGVMMIASSLMGSSDGSGSGNPHDRFRDLHN